jgi:hypothetical protein
MPSRLGSNRSSKTRSGRGARANLPCCWRNSSASSPSRTSVKRCLTCDFCRAAIAMRASTRLSSMRRISIGRPIISRFMTCLFLGRRRRCLHASCSIKPFSSRASLHAPTVRDHLAHWQAGLFRLRIFLPVRALTSTTKFPQY